MGDRKPCHLLQLPDEILYGICTLFCEHCTDALPYDGGEHEARCREALTTVAQTCRKLRNIVLTVAPHYLKIDLRFGRESGQRLRSALAYLQENPDMARYVKKVVVYPLPQHPHPFRYHANWRTGTWYLKDSWSDLEMLFGLLKNFDLRMEGPGLLRMPEMILVPPYKEHPPRLDNLKVLELDTYIGVPIPNLIRFNTLTYWRTCCYWAERMSNLHTLRLINLYTTWDNQPEHGDMAYTVPSSLRVLEFQNCALENENDEQLGFLTRMIEQNENLQKFTFSLGASESYMADGSPGPMSPSRIIQALSSRKSTLRVLGLNFLDPFQTPNKGTLHESSELCPYGNDDLATLTIHTDEWYVSPSLMTSFTALEELYIDEQSFCKRWMHPVDFGRTEAPINYLSAIIPQSVKKLVVRLKFQTLANCDVYGLGLDVADGKFPNLQSIVIITKLDVTRVDYAWLSTLAVFIDAVRQAEQLEESMTLIEVKADVQIQVREKPPLVLCIAEARQIIGEWLTEGEVV